jgi:hypothetical protein
MKAGIYFTGSGPILLLTSYKPLKNPRLADQLNLKGIGRNITFKIIEVLKTKRVELRLNWIFNVLCHFFVPNEYLKHPVPVVSRDYIRFIRYYP